LTNMPRATHSITEPQPSLYQTKPPSQNVHVHGNTIFEICQNMTRPRSSKIIQTNVRKIFTHSFELTVGLSRGLYGRKRVANHPSLKLLLKGVDDGKIKNFTLPALLHQHTTAHLSDFE
jgi:hypothetical protein